ncbi:Chaperone protein dnaJ 49 [Capsicum baccatum]|uniref:Chaperone protein dnaJ 49 n=1 Tax=Capsicum baccatum TaxID=33114 RepID=A0A2G2V054_CAPBA|nr:Chaperone protein dnaJ 49 [Capsicum baccatum]
MRIQNLSSTNSTSKVFSIEIHCIFNVMSSYLFVAMSRGFTTAVRACNRIKVEAGELNVTMDSNKDEALRCISIAKESVASGDKHRALKFIGIARRLNKNLSLDDLLDACENLDSSIHSTFNEVKNDVASVKNETGDVKNYREEHVELIRRIKCTKDYYEILGLKKCCSVDEIRKAYRRIC